MKFRYEARHTGYSSGDMGSAWTGVFRTHGIELLAEEVLRALRYTHPEKFDPFWLT